MKNFKFLYLLIAFVAAAFATSCTETEYTPGEAGKGTEVYFSNENASSFSLSDEDTSIELILNRIKDEEAQTVSILSDVAAESASLFTIPNSVTFAAGEKSAKLTIGVDIASLEDDTDYNIELLLNDEENTTPYGLSSMSITVVRWPWELWGTGKLRDDFFSSMFDWNLYAEVDVNIHKHKSQEGIYMLEEPWGPNMLGALLDMTASQIEAAGIYRPTNVIIDCSDPNDVFIPLQDVGVNVNDAYGWIMIGTFNGGTLENGVITFPVDGLAMRLPNYQGGSNFRVNSDGMFRILFPGAEVVDYSLVAVYDGMKVEADGETSSAVIDFTYGADVTGINYVVSAGNLTATEINTLAASLIAGTAENVNNISNLSDEGTVSEKFALTESGMYTVVAVALDKAGKPTEKGLATTNFFFPGMGGADAPECDLDIFLGYVSECWPEQAANLPDDTSIYFEIGGSELKTLKSVLAETSYVESLGITAEEFVDAAGTDRTSTWMPYVNERGFYGSAFINLDPGTSYTFIVKATNVYGKSAVKSLSFSTAEGTVDMETPIVGRYAISYSESSGYACSNTFTVEATENANEYLVSKLGDSGSPLVYYGIYDEAANTFTLDGKAVGYESYGNVWGRISIYTNAEKTEGYRYWVYDDPTSDTVNDPLVITVDPATKKLNEFKTYLELPLISFSNGQAVEMIGTQAFFPIGTICNLVGATTSSVKSVAGNNVPFSSVCGMKARYNDSVITSIEKNDITAKGINATANTFKAERKIATLKVNAQACEPLQKKTGSRTIKSGTACLNGLK